MHLEYAFCSALSMRSFVQYVQFLLIYQSSNSTNNDSNESKSLSYHSTNLMPYLYDPYSSLTSSNKVNNEETNTYHHAHHKSHHFKLTPVPENTRDDLQTSGFLIILFLLVFLLKTRGIKVSLIDK